MSAKSMTIHNGLSRTEFSELFTLVNVSSNFFWEEMIIGYQSLATTITASQLAKQAYEVMVAGQASGTGGMSIACIRLDSINGRMC